MIELSFLFQAIMYLNCMFEVFLLYNFLEPIFPLYEDRKKVLLLKYGACETIIFCINQLQIPHLNLIGVPAMYMVFVWLVFRISVRLDGLYVLFYYLILAVTEFIFQYIYLGFEIDTSTIEFNRIVIFIIEKFFEFSVIQIIRKKHQYSPKTGNYSKMLNLFIFPVAVMILLNGFLMKDKGNYGYILVCIGGVFLIISNMINFLMVEKLLQAEDMLRDNEIFRVKTLMEEKHYQRVEEINKEYAEYMHEMKHVVQIIESFSKKENGGDWKRLASEATELLQKKGPWEKRIFSPDPVLNAVFIEREKSSETLGVRFEADIQPGILLDFMEETDKIRIFGNLLDNALEAASNCGDGYVSASLYMGNESVIIFRIVNNFIHKIQKRGMRYLSTKTDGKSHGFGLQKTEELIRKYSGMMNIVEEEKTFTVMVILSKVQKTT